VTAATVGAALPFLPLLIAAAWIALWWRRRTATA
jgi:prepilin signal peptidase PulO-like enzyme (type II secretory pathway)